MVKWEEFYSGPRTVFTENFDAWYRLELWTTAGPN
jgi:hypothetical protein